MKAPASPSMTAASRSSSSRSSQSASLRQLISANAILTSSARSRWRRSATKPYLKD